MKHHENVHVSITWHSLNGKKRRNEQIIDLVDEIIIGWEPLAKIASALHTNSGTGIAKQIRRIADNTEELKKYR